MVLGEVVSHVEYAFSPDEIELTLFYSVTDPVKAHVKGFGEFLAHGCCEYAFCCFVVSIAWCASFWLRMAELDDGDAYRACVLGCHVYSAGFGFCCRGHDVFDCVAHDMDG